MQVFTLQQGSAPHLRLVLCWDLLSAENLVQQVLQDDYEPALCRVRLPAVPNRLSAQAGSYSDQGRALRQSVAQKRVISTQRSVLESSQLKGTTARLQIVLTGTRPRKSGRPKVVLPSPPYVVPSRLKRALFCEIGSSCPSHKACRIQHSKSNTISHNFHFRSRNDETKGLVHVRIMMLPHSVCGKGSGYPPNRVGQSSQQILRSFPAVAGPWLRHTHNDATGAVLTDMAWHECRRHRIHLSSYRQSRLC